MKTYFLGDPHFGHTNIIKYCKRPYASVEAMDEDIIRKINAKVNEYDLLWCLGDWSFNHPQQYKDRLKCKNVHLIRGNHDYPKEDVLRKTFLSVQDVAELRVNGKEIILCHYPLFHWNRSHRGSWHLYGHVHGLLKSRKYTLSCDVGVDVWNFEPVSIEDLQGYFKDKVVPEVSITVPPQEEGYDRVAK